MAAPHSGGHSCPPSYTSVLMVGALALLAFVGSIQCGLPAFACR